MDNANSRLLIVDDERPEGAAVHTTLRQLGYEVDAAHDTRAALQLLRAHAYQVVLSPAQLPDGSAAELLAQARHTRADAQLILITGCKAVDACDPVAAGAFGCVCKPVDRQRLQLVVAKALEFEGVVAEVNALRGHAPGNPAADAAKAAGCEIHAGMTVSQCEEILIRHTLEHATSNRAHAARLLGISRRTLQYKLKEYGLVAQKHEPAMPAGATAALP